jgi:antitoxin YefM
MFGGAGRDGLMPILKLHKNLCNVLYKEIVTYSKARANLKSLMDRVVQDCVRYAVTRQRGKPVVMISLEDWNSIQEMIHLRASAANAPRLDAAIADAEAGRNMIEVDPETFKPL